MPHMGIFRRKKHDENRLDEGLARTRKNLFSGIATLFRGKKELDADLIEELETRLLTADVGVKLTQQLLAELTARLGRKDLADGELVIEELYQQLMAVLLPFAEPLAINKEHKPFIILLVGVNGSGKTTTIGKLAKQLQQQGNKVMLAAGDTFRAAAIEQLQHWGERNSIPVIAQGTGADSAAVIHDAIEAAKARNIDVLIADTAGRLHTQSNLMEELKKIKRVIAKLDASAPHEIMLIVDAGNGQNALMQARQFKEAIAIDSITLTKLDGTAKGGIIFAIARELQLPIRFVGVGEKIDDLRTFTAKEFVDALFGMEGYD